MSELNKDIQGEEAEDFAPDLISLLDEDGVEHEFEILDALEEDGENYMALIPISENPEDVLDDSDELVILKVLEEDGEEFLGAIEDEAEFDKIAAIFMEHLEEDYDFEK